MMVLRKGEEGNLFGVKSPENSSPILFVQFLIS